jgi:hypothetical protein
MKTMPNSPQWNRTKAKAKKTTNRILNNKEDLELYVLRNFAWMVS